MDTDHAVNEASSDDLGDQTADDQSSTTLLSSSQAARRLGIHRSSLYLAAKRGLIAPDKITPGGHYRFAPATLDSFAPHLVIRPVTSQAPLIGKLGHAITTPEDANAVFEASLREICQAVHDLFLVVVIDASPGDCAESSRVVAEISEPPGIIERFMRENPTLQMSSRRVIQTGEPIVCDDISRQIIRDDGTAALIQITGCQSFAVLPLMADGEIMGALGLGSRQSGTFTSGTLLMLDELASELGVLLAHKRQVDTQRRFTLASGRYVRELNTSAEGEPEEAALGHLMTAFAAAQQADEVFVEGRDPAFAAHSALAQKLVSAMEEDEEPVTQREESGSAGKRRGIGVTSILGRSHLKVGAIWQREQPLGNEHVAAVYTFAGLCALRAPMSEMAAGSRLVTPQGRHRHLPLGRQR